MTTTKDSLGRRIMPVPAARPLGAALEALPARIRERLEAEAQSYVQRLDEAIAEVLSPTIGKSGDGCLVTDETIPLYGAGATPDEAMADYRSVVVEYYDSLEQESGDLNGPLQQQLELLRRLFERVERNA